MRSLSITFFIFWLDHTNGIYAGTNKSESMEMAIKLFVNLKLRMNNDCIKMCVSFECIVEANLMICRYDKWMNNYFDCSWGKTKINKVYRMIKDSEYWKDCSGNIRTRS